MSKRNKKSVPRHVIAGERAAKYAERLKTLRGVTSAFDAKKFSNLYKSRPRTDKGKRARLAALKKVATIFARVRPFVHRPHKVVKVRPSRNAARNLDELRKYAGFPSIKGLRGVPIASAKPKSIKVSFDRKGRPVVKAMGRHEKLFRFPHMPRGGDDAIEMVEQMLADKQLPAGFYIVATRHHFLIGGAAILTDRESLAAEFRRFVYQYGPRNPEFIKLIYGVKWIAGSGEAALRRREQMSTERGRVKAERERVSAEKKAREVRAMHYRFSGERLPLPKLSKRARATGRR